MAGTTTASNTGVIHIGDRRPGGVGVAIRTKLGAGYVIWWLHGCAHEADAGMTGHAGRIRSLECAARVAAFASYVCMRAIQVKAGTEVIERFLREQYSPHQYQYEKRYCAAPCHLAVMTELTDYSCLIHHCIDLTLRNESAE